MLGLFTDFVPKHVKQYAKLADIISSAVSQYAQEVKSGVFPTAKESITMDKGYPGATRKGVIAHEGRPNVSPGCELPAV